MSFRNARWAAFAILFVSVTHQAAFSQESNDPFADGTKTDPSTWSNQRDRPERDGVRLIVPIANRDDPILLGSGPCKFAAIGTKVFDLAQGNKIGDIVATAKPSLEDSALSPDGQYYARETNEDNVYYIEVTDCQAGKRLPDLRYTKDRFQRVDFLQFTKHNYLVAVVADSSGSRLLVYRPTDGKILREKSVSRIDASKVAITDNGKYCAIATSDSVEILDLAKGEAVSRLEKPPVDKPLNLFIFVCSLAFSPDSTEIAGLISVDGFRFVVWDSKGAIIEDHKLALQIGGAYNNGAGIEWAPDGQGWLLHGNYYFDRQLKAVAWILKPPVQHNYHHRWLDNEHIVASQGDFQNRDLVSVAVPRADIARTAQALAAGADALLKPGDSISVNVQMGKTRFAGVQQVQQTLFETVSKRLQAGGLSVAPGQPVTLNLYYSEKQGKELRVVQGPGVFGRDTGQRVQETVVNVQAKMVRQGIDKPIWEKSIDYGNPHHIRSATVNDAAVRQATARLVEYVLSSMSIPYFVPADPQAMRLPVIKQL